MSLTNADVALRTIFKKIYENRNKEIVYKQDVVDTIITWIVEENPDMKITIDLIGRIYGLPLHEGHWISLDDFRGKYNENGYKCSECGNQSDYEENYCPNCGARMVREGEEG